MKLLILTQTIDSKDPILGFFHNWIVQISKKCEKVSVICLRKGEHSLPANVSVYSLGKESGRSKIKYIKNFFNLILGLHREYDRVFVHMNEEYVILGGWFWKLLGKPIFLWRNHQKGSLLTRFAVLLSKKVFCTSKYSFTARFKKTVIMPVGVDTDKFRVMDHEPRVMNSVLFLGRMDRVKKPDLLIEALNILDKKGIDFVCDFYGDPTPDTGGYYESLKNAVEKPELKSKIIFHKGVANFETPKIYSEHKIFVNLTPTGSFDKTILEAAACGCLPVVVNKSLEQNPEFSGLIAEETPEDVAGKIAYWLKSEGVLHNQKSLILRAFVVKNHSLCDLLNGLVKELGIISA